MVTSIDKRQGSGFRPAPIQSLAGALLLAVLLCLGGWQLRRADEKAALLAAEMVSSRADPVAVTSLGVLSAPQHVLATGRYDQRLFLLDNRIEEGRAGYELLAPLRLADGQAVLVNLGWYPQGGDRAHLPVVQVPDGEVSLTALAVTPAPPAFELAPHEAMDPGWPKVVQAVIPAGLSATLGYPLLPLVLYPDGSDIAARRQTSLQRFGPERHRAYAVQWFVMAAVLLVLYLQHGFKRGRQV